MAELKVGGEVVAWCTKCRMVLAHTVLALWAGSIKRVRCNTCMGEHGFRPAEPGSERPSSTGARAPRARAEPKPSAEAAGYEALIAGKSRAGARRYHVRERFALGDLVEHVSFGLGVVAAVRELEKVDVVFPAGVKTLIHNKGGGPAQLARPLPARRPDVEVEEERHPQDPTAETSDEPEPAP